MQGEKYDYAFAHKWTAKVNAYGFTQVPNLLIYCQGHLNLSDGELVVLIQLMSHWFKEGGDVYPTISTLASYSQKSYATLQHRLMRLEQKGFLERNHRLGTSNIYELEPIVFLLRDHLKDCPKPPRNWDEYRQELRTRDYAVLSSPDSRKLSNKEETLLTRQTEKEKIKSNLILPKKSSDVTFRQLGERYELLN